jgi:hypothetical protein
MPEPTPPREPRKVPYAKYAFWNPYNLTLFGGAITAAAATGNWGLGAIAAGAEALWMLFAPDSRLLRRVAWDKKHAALQSAEQLAKRNAVLAALPAEDAARCRALGAKKAEIDRLCGENPALTAEMLARELQKLDALVESFLDLSTTSHRYQQYLESADLNELEANARRCRKQLADLERAGAQAGATAKVQRELLQKNLDVLMQRQEKLTELWNYVRNARTQLDLIENTFQLLADQIVTMRSPQELSSQLDDLMDGVEAIRQTSQETEKLLATIER